MIPSPTQHAVTQPRSDNDDRVSDEAVIALAGVLAGGVVSVATVLVAPLVSARIAGQRFREQLLAKAVEDVAAILDTAGLALEEFHWALERTVGGLEHGVRDAEMDDYRSALKAAQSDASRFGSRLAIRLGTAKESNCVRIYDSYQSSYRELTTELIGPGDPPASANVREKLSALAEP